jgi:saccharopine dehydrogenase (NAD+, L-lysine-forming)
MSALYLPSNLQQMIRIGLIREEKTPMDTRAALSPEQCAQIVREYPGVQIVVEPSSSRCFADQAYKDQGIELTGDLSDCDILLGIKEVPIEKLIEGKTYMFFSHTKKKQPYNQKLMKGLIGKRIRMIDYECLTHADGQRILGFGFFAGVVGAHNGLLTYGRKFGKYELQSAHETEGFDELVAQYKDIYLPNIKIALVGAGKVASGIVEVMDQFDIEYIEAEDYLAHEFDYPVYTHLKGHTLYQRKDGGAYHRDDFHANPGAYNCLFPNFLSKTDILMNGIYWDKKVPRLFDKEDVKRPDWRMNVIADITCDVDGSVPINVGASTIMDPVYGIDRTTLEKTAPFQNNKNIIDVMAVDNLPNELACDASRHFGLHLEKYVLAELLKGAESDIIARATICSDGKLTSYYEYLSDYAY